ncbi:hypothetical protein FBUS_08804 [Fasciolopsis buskii]|uniref:HMG box domain-containing protein n=1 Tax=Fasciolopsis buskii TaxID=27845 RepID=A0A8E0RWZ1_9TREM|nr:hypothetical protein FBUS_08804 [Fasciolopsis buski]
MSECLGKVKKQMPHITTYNSDDSNDADEFSGSQEPTTEELNDEDDADDNRPLSELRRISKTSAHSNISPRNSETNNAHTSSSPASSSLSVSSTSAYSSSSAESDGETDGHTETALDQLTAKFSRVPVSELISSDEFRSLRKRIGSSRSNERPLSAYALFFKEMLPGLKSSRPNIRFGEIVRLITAEWDSLPPLARKEYKLRGSNCNKNVEAVVEYKTRLINLDTMDQRLCCNPSCSNPVRSDPRWNDQYCSTECVRDHCNLVFSKWLTGKRPNERNPHPCPSTNPADPVVERPVPTNLTPVPFIKQEPHESVPDDLAGRNTSSPAHFPNEGVSFLSCPIQPPVQSDATSGENVKQEDSYIPSTLTNRKSLFESLRICPVSFSSLTKEASKSTSVELPKNDR